MEPALIEANRAVPNVRVHPVARETIFGPVDGELGLVATEVDPCNPGQPEFQPDLGAARILKAIKHVAEFGFGETSGGITVRRLFDPADFTVRGIKPAF